MPPSVPIEQTLYDLRLDTLRTFDPKAPLVLRKWMEEVRRNPTLTAEKVSLSEVMVHRFGDPEVTDDRVREWLACIHSTLHEREVKDWYQPLMRDGRENLCGLLFKKSGGRYYVLLQAVEEHGIIGQFQVGPTVQMDQESAWSATHKQIYASCFTDLKGKIVLADVIQSEEGGRFFKDKKHYVAVLDSEDAIKPSSPSHRWVEVGALKQAAAHENVLNVFARTFLSILL